MDEILMMTVILVIVNGAFDAIVVAYLAGRRSKEALMKFLNSSEADSYYEKIARKAEQTIVPGLELKMANMNSSVLSQIPKPNYSEMEKIVQREISKIQIPEIPPYPDLESMRQAILSDLNGQLNEMLAVMSETIQTSLKQEYKALKSGETRKMAQELREYGVQIDDLGNAMRDEMMANAAEGMTPMEMAAMRFLAYKPSPAWVEENPGAAGFLEFSKMMAVQYAQGVQGQPGNNGQSGKSSNPRKTLPKGGQDRSGIFG